MAENVTPRQETREETLAAYKKSALPASWAGRGTAFWGIAGLGLALGAAVGVLAPFFPVLVGAQSASSAISLLPHSLAMFSAIGAVMGSTAGAVVGTVAGAAAGVATEQEARFRQAGIALAPVPEPEQTDKKPFSETLSEYVNPKVGAVVGVIGAVGGALLGGAYIALGGLSGTGGGEVALPAMKLLLGSAAGNPVAVTAYCAGVMGSLGAIAWSINFPKIAEACQRFSYNVCSGEYLGTQWGPKREPEQALAPETPSEQAAMPARALHADGPRTILLAESVSRQAISLQAAP